ncbi:MAG: pilus assembly protein PilM [Muribaculaceae bacterium]|nr:pilus assembly protein PilM [Muribaculaceae bacterium]
MEQRTIVAIEIASSKIKGAVAAVGPDGRLVVLAVEEMPGVNNVRYGRIQNIREVSAAVNEIVRRLENSPQVSPRRIEAMSISLGGRSLSATPAQATLRLPRESEITENHVQRLEYEATRDFVGDKNIEAMVPRMFYVNNVGTRKAVGFFGETLRGEFMMLTCGKETRQSLDRLKFDTVERENAVYEIRPLAIGELVLTSDERELGCALVDFGAETTTVSVYKDGTLAFLSTIPMGSRLITLDLMAGLGMTEEAAENYKLALPTLSDRDIADNPNAEEKLGYVRARVGEIAANILNQIEHSGYSADSLSRIVLVGGGAKLPDFATQLGTQCKMPVRVAEMPADIAFRVPGRNNADNIDIVALLAAGARRSRWECLSAVPVPPKSEVVDDIDDADDDFTEEEEEVRTPRTAATKQQEGPRKPPAEDDEDLLNDDEDEPVDEPEEQPVRRGIFGLGRKPKKEEPQEKDEFDVFEDDEEEYDDNIDDENDEDALGDDPDTGVEGGDNGYSKATIAINKLREGFCKIFKSPVDEEDDED